MLHHIFAQRLIDRGPVSRIPLRMSLEPVYDVGVEPEGDLLLDGTKKRAAPRPAPIALLGKVAGVDPVLGERGQMLGFGPLFRGEMVRNRLLHRLSSQGLSPCER